MKKRLGDYSGSHHPRKCHIKYEKLIPSMSREENMQQAGSGIDGWINLCKQM